MTSQIQIPKTFHIFYYAKNKKAELWAIKLYSLVAKNFKSLTRDSKNPELVLALGGDGTILDAARKYRNAGSVILGLNLGTVGFLASVRDEKDFLKKVSDFLKGKSAIVERMMIKAEVKRKGKTIFECDALNEVVIKNPLGVVEIETKIADHPVQYVRGTGVLIATATGSTAYNLSAHGPIVMPNIKCLILTEILDHSIPTPSIVIKYDNKITSKVVNFRKKGLLSLSKTGEKLDVVLVADGDPVFALEPKDEVVINGSPDLIKFAELEKHHFFKSLEEKFGFK